MERLQDATSILDSFSSLEDQESGPKHKAQPVVAKVSGLKIDEC